MMVLKTDMDNSPLSIQLRQVYKLSDKELRKVIQLFETIHVQRIPLYQIAAYLAMTPETLSRIRKKLSGK